MGTVICAPADISLRLRKCVPKASHACAMTGIVGWAVFIQTTTGSLQIVFLRSGSAL
jgi:hypothetical protein